MTLHVKAPRSAAALVLLALAPTASPACADARVETGAMIYGDYCSSCHGDELKNTSGGVTFDLRRLKPDDHERFVNSVLNGKRTMPPWRGALADEQIEAIWAYIRATLDK
jgi:mono/diheme cytochrome c family protein